VILQNGITFLQNFNAQYFTQQIIAGATPQSNAFSFKQTISGSPLECIIAAINLIDPTQAVASAVSLSWYSDSGVIFVTAVNGLTSGTVYNLRVRVC
jgi:uncharacterized membrane protein YbjE (DUF340 family)